MSDKLILRTWSLSLSIGRAVIQFPMPLTNDDSQDLLDLLKIVERQIIRDRVTTPLAQGVKEDGD